MMLEDMIEYRPGRCTAFQSWRITFPRLALLSRLQLQGWGVRSQSRSRGRSAPFLTRERRILWRSGRIWMHCPSPSRPAPFSSEHPGKMHACGHDGTLPCCMDCKNCGGAARNAAVQCAAGVSAGGGESRRRATAVPQRHLCALSCPGDFWFPFVAGAAAGRNCPPVPVR